MTDAQARLLFLAVYAVLMVVAFKVAYWFVYLFPQQVWYFGTPALIGLGVYLVLRDRRSRAAGTKSVVKKPLR